MQPTVASCYVSVVIPLCNEEENLAPLLAALDAALAAAPFYWELILVDDGSLDRTLELALAMAAHAPHMRVIALQRNYGQTAAMQAGIEHANGDIIVTLDGDLQNDPADIARMVAELQSRQLDLLVGWRQQREDHRREQREFHQHAAGPVRAQAAQQGRGGHHEIWIVRVKL